MCLVAGRLRAGIKSVAGASPACLEGDGGIWERQGNRGRMRRNRELPPHGDKRGGGGHGRALSCTQGSFSSSSGPLSAPKKNPEQSPLSARLRHGAGSRALRHQAAGGSDPQHGEMWGREGRAEPGLPLAAPFGDTWRHRENPAAPLGPPKGAPRAVGWARGPGGSTRSPLSCWDLRARA